MRPSTNRDLQRTVFIDSLYGSLKKRACKVIEDNKKCIHLASNYLKDGLSETECVELLVIDGFSREQAEGLTAMAMSNTVEDDEAPHYSFVFEDSFGKVCSSHDLGKRGIITASSEDDAWIKAEEYLDDTDLDVQKIISVSRAE